MTCVVGRQRYGIGRIFDSQICSRCGEYNQDPHQDYYVHKLIDELVERKEEIMGQQCINRDLEKRLENQEIIKLRIAKVRISFYILRGRHGLVDLSH